MAPEQFSGNRIKGSSKESDVYSLAMTSFEVCFSTVSYLTIRYDHPVTIRSSRGYCHTVIVTGKRLPPTLDAVNDPAADGAQVGIGSCTTPFGIQ
jgi:serine/threonine protein kinase